MFHDYHIPKSNLLDKVADVSNDGTYIPRITEKHKQFGILMGILLSGRIRALGITTVLLRNALSIAIRYATCVEPSGVLENQSQQIRLIPWLAVTYISHIMHNYLDNIDSQLNSSVDLMDEKLILELHALSSATKPVITWLARDGIQTCKEMCKTYGHLKGSCLADLYNLNDPMYTLEGDNNVLIQQTANWLLKLYEGVLKGDSINFPLSSVNFIKDAGQILNQKFNVSCHTNFSHPQNIVTYYEWLTCYILKETFEKQQFLSQSKLNGFWIKNDSQVYFCRTLGTAYIMVFFVKRFKELVLNAPDHATKTVLLKLLSLYGLWNLQKYIHYFYQGGYATTTNFAQLTEEAILMLCSDLKDDAVSLVDAISPPDFLVNSVFGYSDGNVYKRLECTITHTPGTFSNVNWRNNLSKWKYQLSKL
ncbi:hypothetical protein RI129_006487 [Pyrocoelia pectoralis]|uniref:Acyl-CoA oxidase n=1 Tax=Pyrocoelia pectoralis TaxID=417401 RepID=A0AAN7ZJQ4_9COLE